MTTKRFFYAGLFLLSFIAFSSCDEMFDERIEGNRNVITTTREIPDFDEVVSAGNYDVYITIADSTSLRIEAEENLIRFIETYVSGRNLYIEEKDDYWLDNNKPMKLFLTTPSLDEILLTGSGKIVCDTISSEYLILKITGSGKIEFNKTYVDNMKAVLTGSGDIILSGKGLESEYNVTGSGSIRAIDFIHNDSESTITGSGNIYVYAIEYLKAVITGSGDIYYEGNPDITERITGTGDLRRY